MKKVLYFFVLLLFAFTAYNKNPFQEKIKVRLNDYTTKYIPEKVYVHTDKPTYALGDDIWFSTYLVDGIFHLPSKKSKVVHVELIDPKNKIVASRKLYYDDISTAGDFKVDETWKEGNYILRAYTNYMRNDSEIPLFQKRIPIISNKAAPPKKKSSKNEEIKHKKAQENFVIQPSIRFYPEGGYLVDDLQNKVALTAKDQFGNYLNLSGTIKDDTGNEILDFKTLKFGYGVFNLTPQVGKKYFAHILVNDIEQKFPLPETLHKGYILNINSHSKSIGLKVSASEGLNLKGSLLIIHQRGQLIFEKSVSEEKQNYTINIPNSEFDNGVVHLTLFNAESKPVAERLVFVNNFKNKIDIQITKKALGSKQECKLKVNTTNIKGENIPSNLSLTVRDLKAYPHNTNHENIKTWLLLNSDLRGEIKNPGYYFEKANDVKRAYLLDIVMLTHGWRRFNWQTLLNTENKKLKYLPEIGIYINGKTKKQGWFTDKAHSCKTRISFQNKKNFGQSPIINSDSIGKFKFGPFVFYNKMHTFIEARVDGFKSDKKSSKYVEIIVEDDTIKSPYINADFAIQTNKIKETDIKSALTKNNQLNKSQLLKSYLDNVKFELDKYAIELGAVEFEIVKKTSREIRREEMNSKTSYGAPFVGNNRLDVASLGNPSTFTAFDLIQMLPGIYTFGDAILLMSTKKNVPIFSSEGIPIEPFTLRSINGSSIDFIDFLRFQEDPLNGGAHILIFSKDGNSLQNTHRAPGIIDFDTDGYYLARTFSSPNHSVEFIDQTQVDLRTTLYWNPKIKTTKHNISDISFYTADIKSDYIIEVEGITQDGEPLYGFKTFVVE